MVVKLDTRKIPARPFFTEEELLERLALHLKRRKKSLVEYYGMTEEEADLENEQYLKQWEAEE